MASPPPERKRPAGKRPSSQPPEPIGWGQGEEFEQTRTTNLAVDGRLPASVALSPARAPYLTAIAGPRAGEVYALDRDEISIGRGRESDIYLDSDGVSRKHARIVRQGGSDFVLEDLGSTNGTFLQQDGGEDVRVRFRKLQPGDRLQIGTQVVLRFAFLDDNESRLQRQLYESAVRDALTGAYNRKFFEDRARAEVAHALRHGSHLSLIMLDIDHFKKINDTWGHPAGDAVLKALVTRISEVVRVDVVFARIGGEEFVLLARGVDEAGATEFAERLRGEIERLHIPWKTGTIPISSSFGVAELRELHAEVGAQRVVDVEALMGRADERLYKAKKGGRNRVVGAAQEA
jgi:diguanylate cyclase (GGDEF)-like protein